MNERYRLKNKKRKKQRSYYAGYAAELLAIIYYTIKGYRVLKWRYKSSAGEVDVVAVRRNVVVFIEVKYRKQKVQLDNVVSFYQRQRIKRSAECFIREYKSYQSCYTCYENFFYVPPFYVKRVWEE